MECPACPACGGELDPARYCEDCGEQWLTPAAVARALGVTRQRVQYYLDTGRLVAHVVPAVRWVRAADVAKLRATIAARKAS
jgi:hypothetical protein